ncbi:MAG TPA: glucuronate isomerase [Bryobacteraceae bacterium]|jgi:glucuronate isomerase
MPPFPSEDFLLETDTARELYFDHVKDLPILDYHCHLPPAQIASDHRFRSITEVWLDGDHYKWRAMRASGVSEHFITGGASDLEKFEAWARTVPETLCNPLYHWTAMELKNPFGITQPLSPTTAREIFHGCNAQLQNADLTTQGLLRHFRVAVVCTTDDPVDSLEHHRKLAARPNPDTRVYPTWRPDKALAIDDPQTWNTWVGQLEQAAGRSVTNWTTFLEALETRHTAFHELGCRASDHGLDRMHAAPFTGAAAESAFALLRSGASLHAADAEIFRSALLYEMALLDHARGWVQQFHVGALRNTNTRMRVLLGPDTGYDAIGDFDHARPLARFLDALDSTDQLPKTILYNSNPADNPVFATIIGNYQSGGIPGKMQWGSAWWFLDQLDGMEAQLRMLANMGLLSRFVGMVTDSRSFLSYSRHDYFRRLVCQMLGEEVRRGRLPDDREALGRLAADISFHNARDYFGFKLA